MEKICQVCCLSEFELLIVAGAEPGLERIELNACKNCGMLYRWPMLTKGQVGKLNPTFDIGATYGLKRPG
jgi:hypothetical protein